MCAPRNFVAALFREHPLPLSLFPLRSASGRSAGPAARPYNALARAHKGNGVREGLGGRGGARRGLFFNDTRYDAAESESRQIVQFNDGARAFTASPYRATATRGKARAAAGNLA